jgi:hypothetical protein
MDAYKGVWEMVPIAWLEKLPGNKLRHDTAEMQESIAKNGLREPLIINVGKTSRTAKLGRGQPSRPRRWLPPSPRPSSTD